MITIDKYKPFEFQKISIELHLQQIKDNNGICIFDQTGLGKTITACTIAVNLEPKNVLILAPKANRSSWIQVLKHTTVNFYISTYIKYPISNYDIVIVDEAHNYKNYMSKSYLQLFKLIKSCKPKVMLLTATPYQNDISELKTMVSLIHFNVNTPAYIGLGILFDNAIAAENLYKKHIRFNGEGGNSRSMKAIAEEVDLRHKFEKYLKLISNIFATFSNRNTRELIEREFSDDYELMGRFPKKHESVQPYQLCDSKEDYEIFEKTIEILNTTPFCLQNITIYTNIKKSSKKLYKIDGLIRCFLLKRLDSSVKAFQISLANAYAKLMNFNNSKFIIVDGEEYLLNAQFDIDYEKDCANVRYLIELWKDKSDIKKLDLLFDILTPGTIVFTEFIDTLNLIKEEAKKRKLDRFITFDGNSKADDLESIRLNFDANLDENIDKYDYLFTTDVLSEGVNLHVAKKVIHYDQKWNPSKNIQRNGRIDRILKNGLISDIHLISFGVEYLLEQIIKLEKTINKKVYQSDLFLNHLEPLDLYTFPKFKDQRVLFYPNEEHKAHYNVYRTYMGDICVNDSNIWSYSNDFLIEMHIPETDECKVSIVPVTVAKLFRSNLFQKSEELSNNLYKQSYHLMLMETVKYSPHLKLPVIVRQFYTSYDRERFESCQVWFKNHKFMNWDSKF